MEWVQWREALSGQTGDPADRTGAISVRNEALIEAHVAHECRAPIVRTELIRIRVGDEFARIQADG